MIVSGKIAFSNITQHEVFQGRSTGKYSVVVSLEDADAEMLAKKGVKIKDYQGTQQRKFSTKFTVPVVNADKQPWTALDPEGVPNKEIPWGSTVKLKVAFGKAHPVHGVTPYLNAVQVLTEGSSEEQEEEDF